MSAGANPLPRGDGVDGDAPITISGHDVVQLMGARTLTETLLLALDGELPDAGRTRVVDAVLVSIAAVEEALRLEAPVQWMYRRALREAELGGATIRRARR